MRDKLFLRRRKEAKQHSETGLRMGRQRRFWLVEISVFAFLFWSLGLFSQAVGQGRYALEADTSTSELAPSILRYEVDRQSLYRSFPVESSPLRTGPLKDLFERWLSALASWDFEKLSQDGKIDYILFRNHLEHQLRQLGLRQKALAEAESLLPFARTIISLEDSRREMKSPDSQQFAVALHTMSKQIDSLRKRWEVRLQSREKETVSLPKKTLANRAASITANLRETLKNWFTFYDGYDPLFTWWVSEPYKVADAALKNYADFLKRQLVGVSSDTDKVIIGDPIGNEALLAELAHEMIPYSPEELIAIANREFAWCENEMKKASRDLGYGDDWKKALEHVKTLHVEPGKQPELVRDLALEAIEFVEKHDLVTVPPLARETWRMEMLTPEQQLVSPFFLGGEVIRVSFPTSTMPHEAKMMSMRGNNIHFSRATVFHELIPGHHLQGFMTSRYKTYRRPFATPFWTEGGALYWEMLFWDLGFPKTPENRIGMLFWRMHRCARIIFSLGFHLEKMTPEECIDFLIERVGHERDNATAEVRRSFSGEYSPLYQCAYMLGALQLRALRAELVGTGRMTNREFHDAILKENSIPIEMLRAKLIGQQLGRDHRSSWKFYGPNPLPTK